MTTQTSKNQYNQLLAFLKKLKRKKIYYRLSDVRDEAIMVELAVPGERWEVEFMSDGTIEIERYKSDGVIQGREFLAELFKRHG